MNHPSGCPRNKLRYFHIQILSHPHLHQVLVPHITMKRVKMIARHQDKKEKDPYSKSAATADALPDLASSCNKVLCWTGWVFTFERTRFSSRIKIHS